MSKLSIITINFNNALGLAKTLASIENQTSKEFEHIIVDGGSTDGSKEIIEEYASKAKFPIKWVSERDKGIYNAMNKGIKMAEGEYIEILNSGDCLAGDSVVERMLLELKEENKLRRQNGQNKCMMIYGNIVKCFPNGKKICDRNGIGRQMTFYDFYHGTMNHDSAYISRELFADDRFGLYDENLRICSDWEWYLQTLCIGRLIGDKYVKPLLWSDLHYVNIDVTHFDMTGISENGGAQKQLILDERSKILKEKILPSVLSDYDAMFTDMSIMRRIHKYKFVYLCVRFVERVLFKFEKWTNNYHKSQVWN